MGNMYVGTFTNRVFSDVVWPLIHISNETRAVCKKFLPGEDFLLYCHRAHRKLGFWLVLWWRLLCVTLIGHFYPSVSPGYNVNPFSHYSKSQRRLPWHFPAFCSPYIPAWYSVFLQTSEWPAGPWVFSFFFLFVRVCSSLYINQIAWDGKSKAHSIW